MKAQSTSWVRIALTSILFLGLFIAIVIVTHNYLTEPFPGHADFSSRWEGTRSFWIDGLNPYGEQASLNIQTRFYGRAALPDEDQVLFAYPMYTTILIAPLVFMEYAWASAIMMAIMEVMLVVALFMLLDMFQFRPRVGQVLLLILISLLHYTTSRGLILGQLGLVSYFMYVVTFWGLYREDDGVAGVALSIATIKPQLGFLIVPFLFLWGLRAKRYRFVTSFVISMGVLVGVSFLLVPTWLTDMWGQVTAYTDYAPPIPTDDLFAAFGLPANAKYIAFVVLWAGMLVTWYQVLVQGKLERAMWAAMVTLAVSNLASPVIATPHFAVLVIPLVFFIRELSRKPSRRRWSLLLLLFLLVEPWIRFALTLDVEARQESFIMSFPEPIAVLVALWVTREVWWAKEDVLKPANAIETGESLQTSEGS